MICSNAIARRLVAGLAALLVLGGVVGTTGLAQDPYANVTAENVDRLRRMIDAADTNPADREAILEQVMDRRRDLIAASADHPEVLFWCAAQVEDDLLVGIPMNALELTVRHGLPSVEQQDKVDAYVRDALRYLAILEANLPARIQAEQTAQRTERYELLRDRRLPFLEGIARILEADRGIASDPSVSRRAGIELLERVRPGLRGEDALTADRYIALGYLGLGELDTARAMFEKLRAEEMASPLDMVGYRLALVDVRGLDSGSRRAAGDAQVAAATNSDPLERLLLIEQAAKYWMITSRAVAGEPDDPDAQATRDELERNAADAFLLLHPEQGGLNLSDQQPMLDLLIEQRLGRLDFRDPAAAHLPIVATIAAAVPLAAEPETAQQARDLLLPLVDRPGIMPRNRARILRVMVQADVQVDDRPAAIEHAIMWSQVAADRPEAHGAAELAATVAGQLAARQPNDEQLVALYQKALNNLLVHFPDHQKINTWRRRSGQLAEQTGQLELARRRYAEVPQDAVDRPDALARIAVIVVREAAASNEYDTKARTRAVAQARQDLEKIQSEFERLSTRFPKRSTTARASLDLASARLDMLEGDAISALDRLSRPGFTEVDPTLRRAVHMARIEAAMKTGRAAAVDAVVDGLPEELQVEIARAMLPTVLAYQGIPLPRDPLLDPGQSETALRLAQVLEAAGPMDPGTEILVIEGLRRGGDPVTALARADALLASNPDLGDALLSKAECLQADPEADRAEAIAIYIRLSKGDEAADPDRFWMAQLRLLQSMVKDGRDTQSVLATLNRLEREHPDLGGQPYVGQFAVLRGLLEQQ